MTTINPAITLASLVNEHPDLAGELERRGLDYCCGGQRTLLEACAAQGLDPASTTAELSDLASRTAPAAEWASMDVVALVQHLVATHHAYLWTELPRLSALLAKIVAVHGERHPDLVGVAACYESVRADLEPHLLKEERVLFPMIVELARSSTVPAFHCATLRNPIAMMLREHDAVGDLLAELNRLTNGYRVPDDGCASYVACFDGLARLESDTHLHIHKENNLLFPMVDRMERSLAQVAAT